MLAELYWAYSSFIRSESLIGNINIKDKKHLNKYTLSGTLCTNGTMADNDIGFYQVTNLCYNDEGEVGRCCVVSDVTKNKTAVKLSNVKTMAQIQENAA